MQNRVLIYSKPNIGDGPPPPELRTNSTFMFCIATAQRKYNRPTEEKCQWWIPMCCHGESQDAQEREREHPNRGSDVSASLFPDVSIRSCPDGTEARPPHTRCLRQARPLDSRFLKTNLFRWRVIKGQMESLLLDTMLFFEILVLDIFERFWCRNIRLDYL